MQKKFMVFKSKNKFVTNNLDLLSKECDALAKQNPKIDIVEVYKMVCLF